MPDLFEEKGFAFDLAGMVAGLVDKTKLILGNKIRVGDIIIGIASTGIHSNGYSLARKVLLKKYAINDNVRGIGKIGHAMLEPTQIYVKPILEILSRCEIHGLANITGGAFTKLLRLKKTGFVLDMMPEPPKIMQLIEDLGVTNKEMYKTFNMGVGFCIISPKMQANKIMEICRKHGLMSYEIGHISEKNWCFCK